MIVADGHVDAAQFLAAALSGVSVPVHNPPVPTAAVAAPAVLIETPRMQRVHNIAECTYVFTVDLLILSPTVMGDGLLAIVDEVVAALTAAGVQCQTDSATYSGSTSNTPASLPAVRLIGE